MTPEQLNTLLDHRDVEAKRSDLLARDGKYGDAIKVREALKLELQTKLKDVPQPGQERLANSLSVLLSDLAELEAWEQLASQVPTSALAATNLVLALLHPARIPFDAYRATVRDAQVQRLIAQVRKLDPKAATLLGPRKVKVVVTADHLTEAARSHFVTELVATLKALGHDAALDVGSEPFEVELSMRGPVSAHLIGDDVDECALIAVAKWPAGGLNRLDLTAHGFGDEETDGACFRQRVREVVDLAAEQILRTAQGLPLAVNLSKAEGPNGVF